MRRFLFQILFNLAVKLLIRLKFKERFGYKIAEVVSDIICKQIDVNRLNYNGFPIIIFFFHNAFKHRKSEVFYRKSFKAPI